ncbi:MAG: YbaK/EbsC family protein [Chloroflexota bacterium]
MANKLSPSAQKIQDALLEMGYANEVIEHQQATRTAEEAAATIGCKVEQIVKSLIFKTKGSGEPILVIASGPNRVDEKIIRVEVGEKIARSDADFVRENTGFSIGGIPPFGHIKKLKTFIDIDLLKYEELWAAAGTPNAVFMLNGEQLVEMTGGKVIMLRKG